MNIITLDFETYFDKDYSLSKLSTEEYVRDPRFEVHGMAIKGYGRTTWIDNNIVREALIDWNVAENAVLCHHSHFDGLILSHHFDVRPAAWLDTLSMSRLLLGNHVSHSLDGLRQHFGMPFKRTPYPLFKGKHWHELTPTAAAEIAAGAMDEVESIYAIFSRFMSGDY